MSSDDPELIRADALARLAVALDVPLELLLDRPRNPFYPGQRSRNWETDAMRADATHPIDREVTL